MENKEIALSKSSLLSYPLLFPALAFAIPFLVSGPQLLTGTLVNCLLFASSYYFQRKNQAIVAVGPSIGALFNGLVFGGFTPYLAYFLPVIWIGNMILMRSFLALENKNQTIKILLPALFKTLFLFAFAYIFHSLGLVPKIFLTAMGIFQLATALMGGLLFLLVRKAVK